MKMNATVKTRIPRENGIFGHMNYDFPYISKDYLDILLYSKYGNKLTSQLVEAFVFDDSGVLTNDSLNCLSDIILQMYKSKWDRLKRICSIDYDPIHNYLDEWNDSSTGTENNSSNISKNSNISNTRTDDLSETSSTSSNQSNNNSVFAFNSEAAVPTDTSSGTSGDNTTVANTGTVTVSGSENHTDTITEENSNSKTRSGKHSGNIGNITTQQFIREEISTWKWNFVNEVIRDVINEIALPIY